VSFNLLKILRFGLGQLISVLKISDAGSTANGEFINEKIRHEEQCSMRLRMARQKSSAETDSSSECFDSKDQTSTQSR